jgi:hypothetical protein
LNPEENPVSNELSALLAPLAVPAAVPSIRQSVWLRPTGNVIKIAAAAALAFHSHRLRRRTA